MQLDHKILFRIPVLPEDEKKYFFRWCKNLPENGRLLMSIYIFTGNTYQTNVYFSKPDPQQMLKKLNWEPWFLLKWLKTNTHEHWEWIVRTVRRCVMQYFTCVVAWSSCVLVWFSLSVVLLRTLSFSVNSNFILSSCSSVSWCLFIRDFFTFSWACSCCSRSLTVELNSEF